MPVGSDLSGPKHRFLLCFFLKVISLRLTFRFMMIRILIIFIYLFIWLRWVFFAARGLSLVASSGGLLLLRSTGSRRVGFSSCGTQAQ